MINRPPSFRRGRDTRCFRAGALSSCQHHFLHPEQAQAGLVLHDRRMECVPSDGDAADEVWIRVGRSWRTAWR